MHKQSNDAEINPIKKIKLEKLFSMCGNCVVGSFFSFLASMVSICVGVSAAGILLYYIMQFFNAIWGKGDIYYTRLE